MPDYMADTAGDGEIIPTDVIAVAGYVDGYRSYPHLLDRYYPALHVLSICTSPTDTAEVLDVEKGAATVQDVRAWVRRMMAAGIYKPCIYASESNMVAVKEALATFDRSEYRLWVAAWWFSSGERPTHVIGGYDAWQYYGTKTGPWDYSIVSSSFFKAKVKKHSDLKRKAKSAAKIHPKVAASTISAALIAALETLLKHHGYHATTLEKTEIVAAAGAIAGYLTPSKK